MFEAKTHLSQLVESLIQGEEDEVIISRRGKPVAELRAMKPQNAAKRIGLAKGRFKVPESIDVDNEQIQHLFGSS